MCTHWRTSFDTRAPLVVDALAPTRPVLWAKVHRRAAKEVLIGSSHVSAPTETPLLPHDDDFAQSVFVRSTYPLERIYLRWFEEGASVWSRILWVCTLPIHVLLSLTVPVMDDDDWSWSTSVLCCVTSPIFLLWGTGRKAPAQGLNLSSP